jgi:hypothetical protein
MLPARLLFRREKISARQSFGTKKVLTRQVAGTFESIELRGRDGSDGLDRQGVARPSMRARTTPGHDAAKDQPEDERERKPR